MSDIVIPLRDRAGLVIAETVVDVEDARWAVARWCLGSRGYAVRVVPTWVEAPVRRWALHRKVLGLADDDPREGDHIDRDKLNNRRSNLRAVPHIVNCQNRSTPERALPRNVYRHRGGSRYVVQFKISGQIVEVGRYDTVEEADAVATEYRRAHIPGSPA